MFRNDANDICCCGETARGLQPSVYLYIQKQKVVKFFKCELTFNLTGSRINAINPHNHDNQVLNIINNRKGFYLVAAKSTRCRKAHEKAHAKTVD
jgi:hypothetical protein